MSDLEPRRSVRSTKGQHKALDQLEPSGPKKRGKKGKKAEEKQEENEEVIRCVCGATQQDDDENTAWIACDSCGAWQHNVCVGVSEFTEDVPKNYFCEQCKPEDHKELLDGIAQGKKPWEDRRRAAEEAKGKDKKKKGGRKGKGKRTSDPKESPAPEPKPETKTKTAAGVKRKSRAASEEGTQKMRKLSESQAVPVPPPYQPPDDLPSKITELLDTRQPPAKALYKSLLVVIREQKLAGAAESAESQAERLALQIERAVHDTHPGPTQYGSRIRTLQFNLKANPDLCGRLLEGSLTPPMLAVMSTDGLASKKLQQETAEMKARAEKQSILVTEDGPRVRRTHKGEEMVENDSFTVPSESKPSALRRQSAQDPDRQASSGESPALPNARPSPPHEKLRIETQQSPKTADFDINKVFSSVRSPTSAPPRRQSQPVPALAGPGVDLEVDRLLQDDREESPPYSPSEEMEMDPSVIWRGDINMSTIANFHAVARYMGGADLAKSHRVPWRTLIPKNLVVAGRIDEQKANEYLCGLRYSDTTDIVFVGMSPGTEAARKPYEDLAKYLVDRKKYAVIGDKGVANVRDAYLIGVAPGTRNFPEFTLNFEDNYIPPTRTEHLLLVVFVYRHDQTAADKARESSQPVGAGPGPSLAAPAFSPTTPQGAFPAHARAPSQAAQQEIEAHLRGEALARHILGRLADCPTVAFILPQAESMTPQEWYLIKNICEREPRAMEDLQYLSVMIEKASKANVAQQQQQQPPPPVQQQSPPRPPPKMSHTPVPVPQVPHTTVLPPRPSQPEPQSTAVPPA